MRSQHIKLAETSSRASSVTLQCSSTLLLQSNTAEQTTENYWRVQTIPLERPRGGDTLNLDVTTIRVPNRH